MATDVVDDGDYLGAYSRFFTEFVTRVNPDDQLPVKVSAYDVDESELVGEVINVTLQYLNKHTIYCPPSLQSYIVHLVIQAIKSTCKKQPEICGLRQQEKTYAPLKLMQAITNEVNEICRRYLDNSRLALLPPPSATPQVTVGATRNARRKMEDRHIVLHDLHTIFNIQDDTIANYYAVFDGHGGQDAAAYCATHLHQYLVESVHYPTDPESALRDAFLITDAQFIAKSNTQKLNGGTTAVCALVINKKLYIAWVGDSMASLVTRGNVKQLVNPHRPTREDESERIRNMGGVVVHCMGVLRVNGFLSISRAIGDVPYKPYISGEPEVRCVSLDGTEDFLIIACDGLWDYVDQRTAALRVYRQVQQNPYDLKHVHQALLQSAKRGGSLDNITVIVVFLTPPIEIASRHSFLTHQAPNGLLLNSMDPNNPVSSNSGQFDENNAAFIKQQQQQQQSIEPDFDLNRVICGMARNGKHQDGDGDEYDYSDLGPETDVDGGEDAADVANRTSSELLVTSSSLHEKFETEVDNMQKDLLVRDFANLICAMDSKAKAVDDNLVRSLSDRDACCDERSRAGNDDNETRVESTTDTHTYDDVDDDESSPSLLRAAKSLQHALITEVEENVADSEDSEEEWNFYRNPDKEDSATTDEFNESVEKSSIQNPESGPEGEGEIQSSKVEASVECERAEEEVSSKPVLIIDTSKKEEPSESDQERKKLADDDKQQVDMDGFQLNPEAAEFVPLSPPLLNNKNLDYPISGSPLKQTPAMDDILVPSQSEFEKEVSLRPKEIDENDQQLPRGEQNLLDLDASEISSTRAEMGDESTTRNASQWSATTRNDDAEGSDEEGYEIVNMDSCAMTMSFTPGDLEAVFEKGVDLNAVHELNDSSDDAEHINSSPPRSPGGPVVTVDGDGRTDTLLLEFDDKGSIDLLCASSTPHLTQGDQSSTRTGASETENLGVSVFKPDADLPTDQLGVAPLDSTQIESKDILNESKYIISEDSFSDDADTSGDERKVVPEQLGGLSSEEAFSKEKSPEQLKLTEETMKKQNEEELDLREGEDKTQLEPTVVRCYEMKHSQLLTFENATLKDPGLLKTISKEKLTEEEQAGEGEAKTQSEDPKLIKDDSETTEMSMEQKRDEMARALNEFNKDNFTKEKEQEEGEVSEEEAKTRPESGLLLIPTDQITVSISSISPTTKEKLKYIEAMNNLQTKSYPEFYGPTDPIFYPETIDSDTEKEFEKEGRAKQPDINYTDTIFTARDPPTQSNWNELYKTNNKTMLLQVDDDDQNCNRAYESKYLKKTDEVEKHDVEDDEDDRHDEGGKNDDVKPDHPTDPSDAAKDLTSLEKSDSQPKDQLHQSTEQKLVEEEAKLEIAKAESEDVAKVKDESKEQKSVDLVTKAKATTTTAKRPTKTISTTTKVAATKTKTVTSPSKVSTTGTRVSTTPSPSQAVSAKKSVAARPKQLVETSRAPSSSAGGSRGPSTKTTTSSRVAMTTSAAATSKNSVSPRVGTTTKSRPITASSIKSSTSTSGTEKKPSLGETSKQVTNRVTARAPTTARTSTTTTKTTLSAKPSSTTITATTKTSSTTSSVTSKRPSSATTTSRTSTARQPATTGASRPKTAPVASATATRPRSEGSTKPATAKSPLTDKQIKDSANKEISRSGALSSSKTTGGSKSSTPVVGSTAAAKSRLSIGKSPGKSTISPTKKTTLTPKAASRTPTAASTLTSGSKSGTTESPKVLQNGILEKNVADLVSRNPVITGSDKPEDDVPRKDASPVNVPTDNQLIVTE